MLSSPDSYRDVFVLSATLLFHNCEIVSNNKNNKKYYLLNTIIKLTVHF